MTQFNGSNLLVSKTISGLVGEVGQLSNRLISPDDEHDVLHGLSQNMQSVQHEKTQWGTSMLNQTGKSRMKTQIQILALSKVCKIMNHLFESSLRDVSHNNQKVTQSREHTSMWMDMTASTLDSILGQETQSLNGDSSTAASSAIKQTLSSQMSQWQQVAAAVSQVGSIQSQQVLTQQISVLQKQLSRLKSAGFFSGIGCVIKLATVLISVLSLSNPVSASLGIVTAKMAAQFLIAKTCVMAASTLYEITEPVILGQLNQDMARLSEMYSQLETWISQLEKLFLTMNEQIMSAQPKMETL